MLKDFTKIILTAKAAFDVIKEKIESKACDLAMQANAYSNKSSQNPNGKEESDKYEDIKGKAKKELTELISEISHRAKLSGMQLKGFVKEKLIELTNDALLDSMELNDIRAEIASLRAEIAELKSELEIQRR